MTAVMNPFDDLESNDSERVEEFKFKIKQQFNASKESWIMTGVYEYYLRTNSLRAVDVMVMVKEPHDKHFFDKALDGLRSANRLQHLTLLGYVVRKRPIWLYKIYQHHLFRELLSILKNECDIVVIVSALLILNILIPSTPGIVGPYLPEIFNVFSKLAAMNANANNYQEVQLVHLQISLYTLFHRLYGMYPNNFVNFLRKEYMTHETYAVFSHTVKPMLDTVRFHHLLITANKEWEIMPERWKNVESHDIIVSCANLLMNGGSSNREHYQHSAYEPKTTFNCNDLLDAIKVTGKQSVAEYCKQLGKGAEDPTLLSPSVRFLEKRPESTPAPIPLTPTARAFEVSSPYSEHEGSSPPEAAVEATPETTPIREYMETTRPPLTMGVGRSLTSFVKESVVHGTVPMGDRSFPASPIKKESSPIAVTIPHGGHTSSSRKMNKLLSDRSQASTDDNIIELKPTLYGGPSRNTNDLIGIPTTKDRTQTVISSASKTSAFVDGESDKKENGAAGGGDKYDVGIDSVDDFDACEPEKSGSPCSSGGLHMPDSKSLSNFALHMKHMRSRHYSQCNSDSGLLTERFSPESSPRDRANYFKNPKVRRTHSCPEMKKSSPNSTLVPSDSPVLDERDEDVEGFGGEKAAMRRKAKKQAVEVVSSATQTDEIPPQNFPYEHLFLDVFPPLHPSQGEQSSPTESVNSLEERPTSVYEKAHSPSKLLQRYIDIAAQCYDDRATMRESRAASLNLENKYLLDQLKLMGVQLQMEEHRREVHAERNRRLLPRSRRNRTLEEHNNVLKDQVIILQKEIQNCNEEVMKIVQEKEAQINREHEAASYWRSQFLSTQQEHKKTIIKCQKAEVKLKEEQEENESNLKQLNQTKAILNDITNDLRSYQQDAMEVKNLRQTVAELQFEILKAGELIVLYRNRLLEASLPIDDQAQAEHMAEAYLEETKKLNTIISDQQKSLEATQALLSKLRKDIADRDNHVHKLDQALKTTQESLRNEIQEWRKKYEEMRALHEAEKNRSNELDMQLNRAKRVTKFTNPSIPPPRMDYTAKRGVIQHSDEGAGQSSGSRSGQSVPKSPSKRFMPHSAQMQLELSMRLPDFTETEAIRIHTSPVSELPKERESPQKTKPEKVASATSEVTPRDAVAGAAATVPETDTDIFKSITKKKTRTECAESGQLRPISFTQFDPEPSSSKE